MIRAMVIAACVSGIAQPTNIKELPYILVNEATCGTERPVREVGGALVVVSCETGNGTTIMQIAVINLAAPSAGRLKAFDIGFCGASVISATAQSGWQVVAGGQAVQWKLPDRLVPTWGVEPRSRVGGFEIQLRPGWQMAATVGADWEDSQATAVMTHDCM